MALKIECDGICCRHHGDCKRPEGCCEHDGLREMKHAAATSQALTLTSLRAANFARQKEWDPNDRLTLSYRGNELAGEVGEACNVVKKLERERLGIPGSRDTVKHLSEELADVIICCDLIAMVCGIDLGLAVKAKFNRTSEKVGLQTSL